MRVRLFEFLAPFYPDEQEPLRVRTFAPREYPKYRDKQSPKPFGDIFSTEYTVTRAALRDDRKLHERLKTENRLSGMYFIVNAGIGEEKQLAMGVCARKSRKGERPEWTQYVKDEDITRFNAFFVESDDKSIGEQLAMLECCPLRPCILITTRKSVHGYWICAPGVTREEWADVQLRLIAYFDSDESIKNPSRVMRLPNLDHLRYDPKSQTIERKLVEITRFEPERRFTAGEMRAAFPPVEIKQAANRQAPTSDAGEYPDWATLGNELRRRMAAHPTAHVQGDKVVLKGVCHDGKGDSALFFSIVTGKYHCDNPGCRKEDVLRAFGLPERPTGKPEWKPKGRLTPYAALRINPEKWGEDSETGDFFARCPAVVDNTLIERRAPLPPSVADEWIVDAVIKRPIGACVDCGTNAELYGEWCFECSELRKFLNDGPNALTCGCTNPNRWRFRGGGFKWYCGNCERDRAPLDAVWSFQ